MTGSAGRADRCLIKKFSLGRECRGRVAVRAARIGAKTVPWRIFSYTFFTLFSLFFQGGFRSLFGAIWGSFGEPFGLHFSRFFHLKNDCFFDAFWDAFWMDFGGPDPRKWSSRVSETLILIKSPFSSQGRFLMQNGAQKAPKMEPKGHSKSMKKVMHFLIEKMIDF